MYTLSSSSPDAAREHLRLFRLGQLFDRADPDLARIDAGTLAGRAALRWVARRHPADETSMRPSVLHHGSAQAGLGTIAIHQPHLRAEGKKYPYGYPGISATSDWEYAAVWGLKRAALDPVNPAHRLWVGAEPTGRARFAMTRTLVRAMWETRATARVYVMHAGGFEWFAREPPNLPADWPYPAQICAFEWRARTDQCPLLEVAVGAKDLPWDRVKVVADGTSAPWGAGQGVALDGSAWARPGAPQE
jgi:hypothetical protein